MQQYSEMRLSRQFQACLFIFLFTKRFRAYKSTLQANINQPKELKLLVWHFCAFCAHQIFSQKKKISRLEIVLITSFHSVLTFTDLFKVNQDKVKTTWKSLKQKQPSKKQPLKKQSSKKQPSKKQSFKKRPSKIQPAVQEAAVEEETNHSILWPYLGILKTNHSIKF